EEIGRPRSGHWPIPILIHCGMCVRPVLFCPGIRRELFCRSRPLCKGNSTPPIDEEFHAFESLKEHRHIELLPREVESTRINEIRISAIYDNAIITVNHTIVVL